MTADSVQHPASDSGAHQGGADDLIAFGTTGDAEAFDRFYLAHRTIVLRYISVRVRRHDWAEDLTNDTFIRAMGAAANFTPRAKVSTWLIQIAKNLCYDHFKKEALRAHPSLDAPASDESTAAFGDLLADTTSEHPLEPVLRDESAEALYAAIDQLGPDKREALTLRVFGGLPYDEIAKIVDAPVGTIKYRVHDAINDLRTLLGADPVEPQKRPAKRRKPAPKGQRPSR